MELDTIKPEKTAKKPEDSMEERTLLVSPATSSSQWDAVKGFTYAALSAASMATSAVFVKLLQDAVPDFQLNFWRYVFLGPLLFPCLLSEKASLRVERKLILPVIGYGLWLVAVNLSFYMAAGILPLSIVGSISRPGGIFIMIFLEWLLLKAGINCAKIIAVTLCVGGILCTIQPWNPTPIEQNIPSVSAFANSTGARSTEAENAPTTELVKGYLLVVANMVLMPGILLFQRHNFTDMNSNVLLFWAWIVGVPICAITTAVFEYNHLYVHWDVKTVLFTLGHSIFAGLLNVFITLANNVTSSLVVQLASSLQLVCMLIGQYTVLVNINPGHHNVLEVIGVITIVIGSIIVPLHSMLTNKSSKD